MEAAKLPSQLVRLFKVFRELDFLKPTVFSNGRTKNHGGGRASITINSPFQGVAAPVEAQNVIGWRKSCEMGKVCAWQR
jgi:hypothetical protein